MLKDANYIPTFKIFLNILAVFLKFHLRVSVVKSRFVFLNFKIGTDSIIPTHTTKIWFFFTL